MQPFARRLHRWKCFDGAYGLIARLKSQPAISAMIVIRNNKCACDFAFLCAVLLGPMLANFSILQQQSDELITRQFKCNIHHITHKNLGTRTLSIGSKMLAYSLLDIDSLTDINRLAFFIHHVVHASRFGQLLKNPLGHIGRQKHNSAITGEHLLSLGKRNQGQSAR